jgi:hypothetical protein
MSDALRRPGAATRARTTLGVMLRVGRTKICSLGKGAMGKGTARLSAQRLRDGWRAGFSACGNGLDGEGGRGKLEA